MSGKGRAAGKRAVAMARLAEALPRSESMIFPKLEHVAPEKEPDQVADAVLRFFAAHAQAGTEVRSQTRALAVPRAGTPTGKIAGSQSAVFLMCGRADDACPPSPAPSTTSPGKRTQQRDGDRTGSSWTGARAHSWKMPVIACLEVVAGVGQVEAFVGEGEVGTIVSARATDSAGQLRRTVDDLAAG